MNIIGLLIIGIILLVIAYTVPQIPPPLSILMRVLGIICVAIALVFIVLGLLGVVPRL